MAKINNCKPRVMVVLLLGLLISSLAVIPAYAASYSFQDAETIVRANDDLSSTIFELSTTESITRTYKVEYGVSDDPCAETITISLIGDDFESAIEDGLIDDGELRAHSPVTDLGGNSTCPAPSFLGESQTITITGADAIDPDAPADGEEVAAPSCQSQSGSLGWLICPVINALVAFSDFAADFISDLLSVTPLSTESAAYSLWSSMRNIALAILVLVTLLLVFGQALPFNIDAYAIKKTLPRLFFGAVGITTSFFIASIAIDIFNVLGSSIREIMYAAIGDLSIEADGGLFAVSFSVIVGAIAAGVGLINLGLAGFLLVIFIPVALSLLMVIVVLIVRQVAITAFTVLAPVAFVLWILPNTEKFFRQWWDLFLKALMMYPIIMLLLASGNIFAVILTNDSPESASLLNNILAIVAITAPLFLIPATFRLAGGLLSTIAGGMQKYRGRKVDQARNPNDSFAQGLNKDYEVHRQKRQSARHARAQGLHHKSTDRLPTRAGKKILEIAAKNSLGLTRGGRASELKDWYAAAGTSQEEMKAIGLSNPFAMKEYLNNASSRGQLASRIEQLDSTNPVMAQQLRNLRDRFGEGNQAAVGAMVGTMSGMGLLETNEYNDDGSLKKLGTMETAAKYFGGTVDDNTGVATISNRQSAQIFGDLATSAGFAAKSPQAGQHRFQNAGVMRTSDGMLIYDRNALGKASAMTSNERVRNNSAYDLESVMKIGGGEAGRVKPDDVKYWGGNLATYLSGGPQRENYVSDIKFADAERAYDAQRENWLNTLAGIQMGYGGASPETQAAYHEHVISNLGTPEQQAIQDRMDARRRNYDPRQGQGGQPTGGGDGGGGGGGDG